MLAKVAQIKAPQIVQNAYIFLVVDANSYIITTNDPSEYWLYVYSAGIIWLVIAQIHDEDSLKCHIFYFSESLTDSNDVYVKHNQGLILQLYLRYTRLYGN